MTTKSSENGPRSTSQFGEHSNGNRTSGSELDEDEPFESAGEFKENREKSGTMHGSEIKRRKFQLFLLNCSLFIFSI